MYAVVGYTLIGFITLGCIILDYVWYTPRRLPKGVRLPPGPPRKPIIGNMTDLPKAPNEVEIAAELQRKYGDIVYLNCFGTKLLLVNKDEVAHDLLEKRSSIYSDRYPHTVLNDLSGWEGHFGFMRYGNLWRRSRRLFHQHFHEAVVPQYHSVQIRYSQQFLKHILDTPGDYAGAVWRLSAGIILEILYGIKIKPTGDRLIDITLEGLPGGSGILPWVNFVDLMPVLRYIPPWFPLAGAKFIRDEVKRLPAKVELTNMPWRKVKEDIEKGIPNASVAALDLSKLASDPDAPEDEEEMIKNVHAMAYGAGSGTTVGALISFVLAMRLYPECQRKAQAELDAVIGENRLPTFEDQDALPYVNALVDEVQRWHPILPFSAPHASIQDDVYNGYFIPKGTIIIANVTAMLRDETKYGPNPTAFNPDRLLAPGIDKESVAAMWGHGRRICPGRYLARNIMFLVVASVLKAFDILPAKDAQGRDIPVKEEYTPGGIIEPKPFQYDLKPRSELYRKIILEQVIDD